MKVKTKYGPRYWNPKSINWDSKSRSKFQKTCKDILRLFWEGEKVCEEAAIPTTLLKIDFVNFTRMLAIEIDGAQHAKFNKFFHNNNVFEFVESQKRDTKKEEFLVENGFKVIRITEPNQLHQFLSGVL